MSLQFRTIRADEIDLRVGTVVAGKGVTLLCYKDARVDMNILDETVGPERWQRSHEVINGNLYCNVGIAFKNENGFLDWIWKQDVGTESNTEKEKGEASDAFKRACFNWGIGRELYTAPFIWIQLPADAFEGDKLSKKWQRQISSFKVSAISYNDNREIVGMTIIDRAGTVVYKFGK